MYKKMIFLIPLVLFLSCTSGPQKINIGHDQCSFCRMTIMTENFACQTVTSKGKVYNYDDLKCQITALKTEEKKLKGATLYVANFYNGKELIEHSSAQFVKSESFKSPMAGNVAAVKSKLEAETLAKEKNGTVISISNAF